MKFKKVGRSFHFYTKKYGISIRCKGGFRFLISKRKEPEIDDWKLLFSYPKRLRKLIEEFQY